MKITRSDTSRAKPISWVTITMVIPSLARFFITSSTSPTSSGSSAEVGSSNSIIDGFIASARAMATRCCWPPDRLEGQASRLSLKPTFASKASARSIACWRGILRRFIGAMIRFSSTVMCGNRLKRWNTMPTLSRILLRSVVRSWAAKPLTTTSPSLTVSRAFMQRRKVLFPEPDGPMMHTTSCGLISQLMPRSTWLSPKRLCKLLM